MAIYQQARPITFEQVIGQEHVKTVLMSALKRGRIGHAYLFSGPRGVGKTTTARLLAMAVNCEHSDITVRPCGECESCLLVRAGNHPDVIELDAASNNSVEDIRDLREKVRLASMRGGMRVWVLDEAHMLSRAASNALLKTLEEPPENLVFILATTEPEKLPPTILSRCQHFRFRRLSEAEIKTKMQSLCEAAGVSAEETAMQLVARAADGAMRDAESLLERLLASGEAITRLQTEEALGLPPQDQMRKLAEFVSKTDLSGLLSLSTELYYAGFAPSSLAEHLTRTLRDALAAKVLGDDDFVLDLSEQDLLRCIHAIDDELDRFSRRDNLFSLEVALIKTVNALMHSVPRDAVAPSQSSESIEQGKPVAKTVSNLPDFDPNQRTPTRTSAQQSDIREPLLKPNEDGSSAPVSWHKVKKAADPKLKAFLNPAQEEITGKTIKLVFGDKYKFHFGQLKNYQDELFDLITRLFGDGYELILEGPGGSVRKKA